VVVAAWAAARAGVAAMIAAAVKPMRSLMVSFPADIFADAGAPDDLRPEVAPRRRIIDLVHRTAGYRADDGSGTER
jgi:hypothetical protein